jgi:hypothetical protein
MGECLPLMPVGGRRWRGDGVPAGLPMIELPVAGLWRLQ